MQAPIVGEPSGAKPPLQTGRGDPTTDHKTQAGATGETREAQARRAEEDAQAAGVIIDSSLLHPAHPAGNP